MLYLCVFDLSFPNQLTANQNAHALRVGSIRAKKKKMRQSKSKMTGSIWLCPNLPFCFSESSTS